MDGLLQPIQQQQQMPQQSGQPRKATPQEQGAYKKIVTKSMWWMPWR